MLHVDGGGWLVLIASHATSTVVGYLLGFRDAKQAARAAIIRLDQVRGK